jgi:protein FAM50
VKKKKKKAGKPTLSFGNDDDEEQADPSTAPPSRSSTSSPAPRSKFAVNTSISVVPKPQTKRSLLQESQEREKLRKEFLFIQEQVKASEIAIPFVFHDGSNIPGGVVRVKKGDFVWVFLDGSRKVGAESGAGVNGKEGEGAKARREWARVGVDDLMLVRGDVVIPHVSLTRCIIHYNIELG